MNQEEDTGITENIVTFSWQRYYKGYPVQGDSFRICYDIWNDKIIEFEAAWSDTKVPEMPNTILIERQYIFEKKSRYT